MTLGTLQFFFAVLLTLCISLQCVKASPTNLLQDSDGDVVGYTKVLLHGSANICRSKECNLGNLVADALVAARVKKYQLENDEFWSDTAIGFMQGGGIRGSIARKDEGQITRKDLKDVLPFGNYLVMVQVTGKTIRDILEKSASRKGVGGFLQVSGVHVEYDATAPSSERVTSVRVLCALCNIPRYFDLEDNKRYNIVLTDYILNGGDGYYISHEGGINHLGMTELEAVEDYIQKQSPIYPGVDWRIRSDGAAQFFASVSLILGSLFLLYLR